MTDFCVEPGDAPDALALIGEVLGGAGVNIEGLCLVTHEGRAVIHFVVEDAVTAKRALERSAIRIKQGIRCVCLSQRREAGDWQAGILWSNLPEVGGA